MFPGFILMEVIERRFKSKGAAVITYFVLALLCLWTLGPIYWVVATSFKEDKEIYGSEATLLPREFTWKNYRTILFQKPFPNFFYNSFRIALVTTSASILLGTLGAYAFIYLHFPGRQMLARSMIVTYLIPPVLLAFPLFALFNKLDLIDNVYGLMLVHLTFTVPFCTWMLMSYFRTVPKELHEAALVDGCTYLGTLFRIIFPLSGPAIAVVTLFSFTLSWNEFLYAILFTQNKWSQTITSGLSSLMVEDIFFWGQMMAGSVLASLPTVLIYFLFQRLMIKGLVVGAVKA
jgi:multiple sugar transport system permease protein